MHMSIIYFLFNNATTTDIYSLSLSDVFLILARVNFFEPKGDFCERGEKWVFSLVKRDYNGFTRPRQGIKPKSPRKTASSAAYSPRSFARPLANSLEVKSHAFFYFLIQGAFF